MIQLVEVIVINIGTYMQFKKMTLLSMLARICCIDTRHFQTFEITYQEIIKLVEKNYLQKHYDNYGRPYFILSPKMQKNLYGRSPKHYIIRHELHLTSVFLSKTPTEQATFIFDDLKKDKGNPDAIYINEQTGQKTAIEIITKSYSQGDIQLKSDWAKKNDMPIELYKYKD